MWLSQNENELMEIYFHSTKIVSLVLFIYLFFYIQVIIQSLVLARFVFNNNLLHIGYILYISIRF